MSLFLPRLNSEFIFNLPSDFIPRESIADYDGILDMYQMPYETVIDFLNSTIKSVSFPGMSVDPVSQTIMRGKYIGYKPSKPVQDLVTTREVNVVFSNVTGNLNYFLLLDIFQKQYLSDSLYVEPITVSSLDPNRNSLYTITYNQIILTSITDTMFDYSVQKVASNDFTLTFAFNFIDIQFNLTKSKIIDINSAKVLGSSLPLIINQNKKS
jgi:hypothetical protein